MQKKTEQQKELGQYIVSDPRGCHGEPTFKGTRKLVRDCIEMAANGLTIDELATRAGLPREAIIEALQRIEFWQTGHSTKSICRWQA